MPMQVALRRLIVAIFLLGGCASAPPHLPSVPGKMTAEDAALPGGGIDLWAPCSREQAELWEASSGSDGMAALKAASCFVVLIGEGGEKEAQLADARRGRKSAERAVAMYPESGLAHYLAAYLTGLEAERDPVRGLDFVPVIEREAKLAADHAPEVDHGGPDRMLGELYLRAPGFPMSVGNPGKALVHYGRSVDLAPGYLENRLGLAEALFRDEQDAKACEELKRVLSEMPPEEDLRATWRKAISLLDRLCPAPGEK
jgi:tetratricopeptide (TPR) repeat protein